MTPFNITGSGVTALFPGQPGKVINVGRHYLTNDATAATTYTFGSSVSGPISAGHYLPAPGIGGLPNANAIMYQTKAGEGLTITLSVASNVGLDIDVSYV